MEVGRTYMYYVVPVCTLYTVGAKSLDNFFEKVLISSDNIFGFTQDRQVKFSAPNAKFAGLSCGAKTEYAVGFQSQGLLKRRFLMRK